MYVAEGARGGMRGETELNLLNAQKVFGVIYYHYHLKNRNRDFVDKTRTVRAKVEHFSIIREI